MICNMWSGITVKHNALSLDQYCTLPLKILLIVELRIDRFGRLLHPIMDNLLKHSASPRLLAIMILWGVTDLWLRFCFRFIFSYLTYFSPPLVSYFKNGSILSHFRGFSVIVLLSFKLFALIQVASKHWMSLRNQHFSMIPNCHVSEANVIGWQLVCKCCSDIKKISNRIALTHSISP